MDFKPLVLDSGTIRQTANGDRLKSYDIKADRFINVGAVGYIPTPSQQMRRNLFYLENNYSRDGFFICIKDTDGSYKWVNLTTNAYKPAPSLDNPINQIPYNTVTTFKISNYNNLAQYIVTVTKGEILKIEEDTITYKSPEHAGDVTIFVSYKWFGLFSSVYHHTFHVTHIVSDGVIYNDDFQGNLYYNDGFEFEDAG